MATRRKPIHATNTRLNFRPNMSDVNIEQRGTKPTSAPTSIGEALTVMVLFICKRSLFYNTNLRVIIYLGALFLISLIADVVTVPRMYLSRSDSIINKYFVKFAWGWNLIILVPFVILTSYVYCCGQKSRIFKHHFLRVITATFFWWFWTTSFNIIEAAIGRCSAANKEALTKGSCLVAGHLWNGFDISGHAFILIYGSLFLIEETRCIVNWDSIKEHIRLEEHHRTTREGNQGNANPLRYLTNEELLKLQTHYDKFTPYIRSLFIVITLFQIMWDVMLLCTMLYYHIMIEKFIGGFIAIATWFITYRIWYVHPKILPRLPGDGVFKYIKEKSKESLPTNRRRTGSIVNGQVPTFMGRPIYQQDQNKSEESAR